MPDWIFKNKPTAYATLATASGTSGATLTLTTGHGTRLPAPGAGQISAVRIENELITYTGNSGDVLTGVTRGAGAANHVAGTEVKNILVEEWANAVTALSTDTKAALAGTSGTPQAANPYVTNADARNSNARTPTAHSHVESDTTGLVADLAARVLSTDSRLSDARTPTAHAISHKAAGGDVLAGVVGGFAPLSSGLLVPTGYLGTGTQDATTFLRGDGTWAVPSGGGGSLALLADSGELGSAAATIDFTSISGSYKELELEWDLRGDTAAAFASVLLRINNDSTANYDWQQMFANNVTTFNALTNADTSIKVGLMPANTATASLFGVGRVQVPNYASTHHKKALQSQCFEAQDASTGLLVGIWGGQWRTSGTAITRLTLLPSAGNFAAGSRALLWGRS
jgi:hypothetical protein